MKKMEQDISAFDKVRDKIFDYELKKKTSKARIKTFSLLSKKTF